MMRQSDWWVALSSGEGPSVRLVPAGPRGGQENKKGIMSECVWGVWKWSEAGLVNICNVRTVGINESFDLHWMVNF